MTGLILLGEKLIRLPLQDLIDRYNKVAANTAVGTDFYPKWERSDGCDLSFQGQSNRAADLLGCM